MNNCTKNVAESMDTTGLGYTQKNNVLQLRNKYVFVETQRYWKNQCSKILSYEKDV